MPNKEDPPEDTSSHQVDPNIDRLLMKHFVVELERRMREDGRSMSAAELELVRKFLGDTGVTVDSVKRGRFGKRLQEIAENSFTDDSDLGGVKLPFSKDDKRITH